MIPPRGVVRSRPRSRSLARDGAILASVRSRLAPVLLAALVGALAACQVVLGVERLPPRADAAESATCAPCVQSSCAKLRAACLDDPKCLDVYDCVARCGVDTAGCRAECERKKSGAAATAAYRDLDACRRVECTDECFGVGGFGATVHAACACTDEVCAPFIRSCIRSGAARPESGEPIGECERRIGCFQTRAKPLDPDDAITCVLERTGGQAEMNAVRFCWQGATCGSAEGTCPMAGGKLTSCIGQYQWSRPARDTVVFNLGITDQQGRVVVGATVAACAPADCGDCKDPVTTLVTGVDGTVDLALSTFGIGFRGCFHVTAPGKMPAIWYAGRPITRDEKLLRVPLLTLDEWTDYTKVVTTDPDPTRGQILIATRDCIHAPASGLTADLPPGSGGFVSYMQNGLPRLGGTTDDSGRAAIVNVIPGQHTVVMHDAAREYGRLEVYTRAGALTGMFMFPAVLGGGTSP